MAKIKALYEVETRRVSIGGARVSRYEIGERKIILDRGVSKKKKESKAEKESKKNNK